MILSVSRFHCSIILPLNHFAFFVTFRGSSHLRAKWLDKFLWLYNYGVSYKPDHRRAKRPGYPGWRLEKRCPEPCPEPASFRIRCETRCENTDHRSLITDHRDEVSHKSARLSPRTTLLKRSAHNLPRRLHRRLNQLVNRCCTSFIRQLTSRMEIKSISLIPL